MQAYIRHLLTNIADPDQTAPEEQSDQGRQCLPLYCIVLRDSYGNYFKCPSFKNFTIVTYYNQLLQLCIASTVWSDPIIRPISVRFGKFTTRMVPNEKQRKTELTCNYIFAQNRYKLDCL